MKEEEFKRWYAGEWVSQCAVTDQNKSHCPDTVKHEIKYKGQKVGLCDRCYKNFQNGMYSNHKKMRELGLMIRI